jgi:DNA-directed RNA polymerase specialized sigma24 family protein
MKLPKNMTEQEVVDKIDKVCNRISRKYTFYGYTVDDIRQESFIICMEALHRYDESRPLENFLSVNLSNRLKNFVRDNHYFAGDSEDRIKLMQPAQLDHENSIIDEDNPYTTSYEDIELRTMTELINEHLPADVRMDYLKMINDVYITKQKRDDIIGTILEILEEYGYYEEG